jgi:hypothetical protein
MDLDVLLIYRLIPRMHELLKFTFFLQWDRQSAFKFNMDLDVLLIYRLIPKMHELLEVTFFLQLIFLLYGIDNLLSNSTWT